MIVIEYPRNIPQPDGYAETLEIDATPTESYNHFAQATENPIEEGAVVSDHTLVSPNTLAFECVISNTPMSRLRDVVPGAAITAGIVTAYTTRSRALSAYEVLLALRDYSPPVRVITGWGPEYENMVVESLLVSRQATTGNSLAFQLGLKHISTAKSSSAEAKRTADPEEDRATSSRNRGDHPPKPKPPTPAEEEVKTNSGGFLYNWVRN